MALTHLQPGYRLDRYEVLWPIAHGGMASVYAARMQGKHGFEKLVAVKTILPQLAGDPRLEKMFLDEARIVSGIRHPNVAEILDVGEQEDILYLVFEWVDGDSVSTLRRVVGKKDSKIPIGIALRIMADACAGLHAAHELADRQGNLLHVVHRDVSPQNIMVTSGGTVKVIDFGVAKAVHRLSGETNDAMLKGKVQYMAPEQALGQPADRRVDIWAAGAVLYQLVSDRLPYEGDNPLVTLHMLMTRMPPAPLPPRVPGPVQSVINVALAHDPRRRYQTAAEMQGAIENVIQQLSGSVTSADIARYLLEHLSERLGKRRQTLQLAFDAARERELAGADAPPGRMSIPELNAELAGLSSPGMQGTRRSDRAPAVSDTSPEISSLEILSSLTDREITSPDIPREEPSASLPGTPAGVQVPSLPAPPQAPARPQGRVPLWAVISSAAIVLVAVGAILFLRWNAQRELSRAAATQPSSSPIASLEPTQQAAPSASVAAADAAVVDSSEPQAIDINALPQATTKSAPPPIPGGITPGKRPPTKPDDTTATATATATATTAAPSATAKPPAPSATAPPGKDPLDVFGTR